jgi:hypothetical protein
MQQRTDYTRCLVYVAILAAALIVGLCLFGLMTGKAGLSLLGASWEFLGAFMLVASVLFHDLALYRLKNQSGLLEDEMKTGDWVRRIPLRAAKHLGSKELPDGPEYAIENYETLFWGTLFLLTGFLITALSQLPFPWLESDTRSVTVIISTGDASIWKRWILGLFISLVIGWLVTEVFLGFLRSWLRITKLPGIPSALTGIVERLFFTAVVGVKSVELTAEIPTAMVAWLGLKLAANWQSKNHPVRDNRAGAVSAALAGLISMLFAFVGGLVCRGELSLIGM